MTTVTDMRPANFSTQVADVLSMTTGAEAVRKITNLHAAEVMKAVAAVSEAREARITAAEDAAAHAVQDAQRQHYLVGSVLHTAQRETIRAAHQFASAAQAGRLLTEIGKLAQAAVDAAPDGEAGAVPVADIERVLATPLPAAPWRPEILAFHPSQQYAAGHFAAPDGETHQTHPFSGWAYVLERPEQPARLVPMFLVNSELRTAAALLEERGIELTRLT